jgi:2-amino-4-hydroxy-6-hydroxymethyldihydropteridine diphosphokinase
MGLSKGGGNLSSKSYESAVIVALGSNMYISSSSPSDILGAALDQFEQFGFGVRRRSSFWRSTAWPDPSEPDYINAVAVVETALSPEAALARLHELEARFGRVRTRPNAPRSLDLDLIAYGRRVQAQPPVLPHPRAAERLFVMGPLAEIAPGWIHPVSGRTAAELARGASVGCDAGPLAD